MSISLIRALKELGIRSASPIYLSISIMAVYEDPGRATSRTSLNLQRYLLNSSISFVY